MSGTESPNRTSASRGGETAGTPIPVGTPSTSEADVAHPSASPPPRTKTPVLSWPAPRMAGSASKPRRARPGQDLIGELFEAMHELRFASDFVSGAEFVLSVITYTIPCAAAMVHVFDINRRQFVVVRASGPQAQELILYSTPGADALLDSVMRHRCARRVEAGPSDPRFLQGRWSLLGVTPESLLCAPVAQGGRYLGAFELVNPEGGGGFYDNEAHALDYIAEQFGEFLAARAIVLEPDVVLPAAESR